MDRRVLVALTGLFIGCAASSSSSQSSETSAGTASSSETGSGTPVDPRLDVADGSTGTPGDCEGEGEGNYDFSFLWVANSPEGTVSKIDTTVPIEVARYRTGPGDPDPSRTSVNLNGDVAVLNRSGGVAKIATRLADCVDTNGDGAIQTSQGPQDVLAWGEDECVLWYRDLPGGGPSDTQFNGAGPRPVAWEGASSSGCAVGPSRLWVSWYDMPADRGHVLRLDGSTGATLDEVELDNFTRQWHGPYGGAVNRSGDLWLMGYHGPMFRIDAGTLEAERFDNPGPPDDPAGFYGMAVAPDGMPWVTTCEGPDADASIFRLDAAAGWQEVGTVAGCLRGIQVDHEGRAWAAANRPCRLVEVDTQAATILDDAIPLPGCETPVGVSIEVDGSVWVVDEGAELAFRLDPDTHEILGTVDGLVRPYTYSDMNGAALDLVFRPAG